MSANFSVMRYGEFAPTWAKQLPEALRLLGKADSSIIVFLGSVMKIQPTETQLTGKWIWHEGHVIADQTCERIDELIRSHFRQLGRDASGWKVLYRDPDDERLWELTYSQSERHGGGPAQLRSLSLDEARQKYGNAAVNEERPLPPS